MVACVADAQTAMPFMNGAAPSMMVPQQVAVAQVWLDGMHSPRMLPAPRSLENARRDADDSVTMSEFE
jgi:hypothetical protein